MILRRAAERNPARSPRGRAVVRARTPAPAPAAVRLSPRAAVPRRDLNVAHCEREIAERGATRVFCDLRGRSGVVTVPPDMRE